MLDKSFRRLEAKIDALLEKAGLDPATFADVTAPTRPPRKLTDAEQQAIDNAPVVPAAEPPPDMPRTNAKTNAPDVASSVPPAMPWAGYDDATVDDIVARLRRMTGTERGRALAYERANKGRIGITRVNWNS